MILFECQHCGTKYFRNLKIPSLWVDVNGKYFCDRCILAYGISHLKYINEIPPNQKILDN